MRFAAAALLAVLPLAAQLTVAVVDSRGAETPVDTTVTVATIDPGEVADTRLRLRNTGEVALRLTTLRVAGTAFSLFGNPTLPYLMAPGTNVDFSVRFAPAAFGSYSATLQANDRLLLVRGDARQAATLLVEGEGGWQPIDTRYPVDLGRALTGRVVSRRFLLRNETGANATVQRITVTGEGFDGPDGITLPASLGGGQEVAFAVRFSPRRAGVFRGELRVDNRNVPLDGAASDPPLPQAVIVIPPDAGESGRQVTGVVRFADALEVAGSVRVTLQFDPGDKPDDAAVQFLPSATRTVTIAVAKGEREAPFVFQTGTTTGLIVLRLEAGAQIRETPLVIPAAAPRIAEVDVEYLAGAINVRIDGFDNTRSISEVAYRFTDAAGRQLEPIRVNAAAAFAAHFRESNLGGLFSLKARFPVTGDPRQIAGLTVELTNPAGTARSAWPKP